MITICHRINSIKQLKQIPYNYGVEVDIRDYKNKLILNHDPFKNGESFLDYLKHFNHKFLIINVKSEGIENKIYEIYSFFIKKLTPSHQLQHKKL